MTARAQFADGAAGSARLLDPRVRPFATRALSQVDRLVPLPGMTPAERYGELYAAHSKELLAFFARRTMDPQVALDLVGETFAEAFAGRRRYRGRDDDDARAWLYGIARNLLASYWRRGYAEQRALRRLGVEPVLLSDQSIARIEELAGTSALRAAVAQGLADLGEDQRNAVELRVVHELPYDEVASRLAISEQTARARVSRALRALEVRLATEVSS